MSSLNLEDSNPESTLTSTTSLNSSSTSSKVVSIISNINNETNDPTKASTFPKQEILRAHQYHYKVHDNQRYFTEMVEMLATWKPSSEVFALRYGPAILGLASTASAAFVNWHFRETLYLLNYTRLSSYVAMFLLPGVFGAGLHYAFVTAPLITQKNTCGVCLQVRAFSLQGMTSIIYPLILVPLCCYPVAKRVKNYSVPVLNLKNPMPVINFTREMMRPIKGHMWAIAAAQVLLAGIVTYKEQGNFFEKVLPRLKTTKNYFSNLYPRPEPQ